MQAGMRCLCPVRWGSAGSWRAGAGVISVHVCGVGALDFSGGWRMVHGGGQQGRQGRQIHSYGRLQGVEEGEGKGEQGIIGAGAGAGAAAPPLPTAFFFPGQGTQRVSMLSYLHRTFPRTTNPLLELLDDTIAASDRGFPPPLAAPERLSTLIAAGPAARLTATENAQPAILFTSLCFFAVLQAEFGFDLRKLRMRMRIRSGDTAGGVAESEERPEREEVSHRNSDSGSGSGSGSGRNGISSGGEERLYFLGHSLGEFCALVAAGIMSLRDAITLVRRRGISMATSTPSEDRSDVGMYALISPPEHLPDLIRTISDYLSAETLPKNKIVQIANHNTSAQIVLSGHVSGIRILLDHLRSFSGHDPRALRLNVSAPFHSQLMAPAVEIVQRELDRVELKWEDRLGEVVANVLARAYSGEQELRDMLPKQAVERVRWLESVRWLEKEKGVRRWIGFGPEVKVGRGLVKRDVCKEAEVVMVGEDMEISEWERVVRLLEE